MYLKNKKLSIFLVCVLIFSAMSSYVVASGIKIEENNNKVTEDLVNIMTKAENEELIPVIIVYKENRFVESNKEVMMLKDNKKIKYQYKNIPAVALSLSKDEIEELKKSGSIENIEYDTEVHMCMDTARDWFGTEKARTDFGLDGNRDGKDSYSKDDVVIAVIDTGIDGKHVDLDGGKVIGWKDFVANKTTPYDDQGHGTHCAGIAAGEGDGNANYRGVAPGAALVGLKVLNKYGGGSMSDVTAAVDWCITNKDVYGIDIISMSLGTWGSSNGNDSASLAVNKAVKNGINVVVAAGNAGPKKYTIGSPGAASDCITVGNMIDVGEKGYGLYYDSSRGPTADDRIKPDIVAPGRLITAAKTNSVNGYATMTGTSMATPFVSGTIALMLDANPKLTSAGVKEILYNTAIDWGKPGKDIEYGHGRLDGYEAIKSAGNLTGTNIEMPDHMYKLEDINSGKEDIYQFKVNSTKYPIAVTLIISNWTNSSKDFDIVLLDPNGKEVASHNSSIRQRTLLYNPTITGDYILKVKASSGSGEYIFDLSCDGENLTLTQDQ
ncbi:S8 family serine peptidase [Clostridiaceae bacterium M8S5]|nr:S8 family serine peptidase [Clostridiaceae bacterium M8S5]